MIEVSAAIDGDRLVLKVCDDGPGLGADNKQDPALSSGVGIANTRERLSQIYGDDHAFEVRDAEAGGLEVYISIPCEMAEDSEQEGGA